MSIKHIIEGYTNLLFKDKTVEEIYNIKKAICNECPHGINGNTCLSITTRISDVTGQQVTSTGGCGCALNGMLRSSKPCPKGKFNQSLV